jgi:hypothetical protein
VLQGTSKVYTNHTSQTAETATSHTYNETYVKYIIQSFFSRKRKRAALHYIKKKERGKSPTTHAAHNPTQIESYTRARK